MISRIILPALSGTSAMTLFSYLVSDYKNRNFREPDVLAQLVKRLRINISGNNAQVSGWVMHYAIGVLFIVFYNELWKNKIIKPSLASGSILGTASGLVGVVAWKGMFELHPNPQRKNLKRFFGHLMLAHVVFGVFCALTYKLTADKNPRAL